LLMGSSARDTPHLEFERNANEGLDVTLSADNLRQEGDSGPRACSCAPTDDDIASNTVADAHE